MATNPFRGGDGVAAQMEPLWDALHDAGDAGLTADELLERVRPNPAWKLPKSVQGALAKARRRGVRCWGSERRVRAA